MCCSKIPNVLKYIRNSTNTCKECHWNNLFKAMLNEPTVAMWGWKISVEKC